MKGLLRSIKVKFLYSTFSIYINTQQRMTSFALRILILLIIPVNLYSQLDTLVIIERDTVYFNTGSSEINVDQNAGLDRLIDIARKANVPEIRIIAHTDLVGSARSNINLSKARSESVKQYFTNHMISDSIITIDYKGEDQPLSLQTDSLSLQQNRRAEIYLLKRIPFVWIDGYVQGNDFQKAVIANVFMHSRFWTQNVETDSTGKFRIKAPRNGLFGLDVTAEGYLYKSEMLKASAELIKEPIKIGLENLAVGKSFDLDQLYFVGNEDLLLKKSFRKLPVLFAFMKSNKRTCIEIKGHINLPRQGKTTANTRHQDLSIARARRIYRYLLSNGIEEERMLYRGYGNWEMVYPNATEEREMALNRRVEIKIADCDSIEVLKNDSLTSGSVFYFFRLQDYGEYR